MTIPRVSLFVLDTGPPITLAAADSLDYLLYPNVPVVIPDAVFYKATRDIAKLGAQSILNWVRTHHDKLRSPRPMPTSILMRSGVLTRTLTSLISGSKQRLR